MGKGNPRLVSWDGERVLTFTFEDALISPESFSVLSGAGIVDATKNALYQHMTSRVAVKTENTIVIEGENVCYNDLLKENVTGTFITTTPETTAANFYHVNADIFCMVLDDNGQIGAEPCVPSKITYSTKTDNTKTIPVTTIECYADGKSEKPLAAGKTVLVDYYVKRTSNAQQIEITADKFGGNYYLEASTLFRRESDGVDMPAEFVIPNGRIQSNFTFTMASSGDPSTFTFTMDAFPDYTKFDTTKKVLAAIQIIDESQGQSDAHRPACKAVGK